VVVNCEIESIMPKHTWKLLDLLSKKKKKILGHKWIFKWKIKAIGVINKYKARLIVKGFKIIKRYELF
jgi:hypothetical protein